MHSHHVLTALLVTLVTGACASDPTSVQPPVDLPDPGSATVSLQQTNEADRAVHFVIVGPATQVTLADRVEGSVTQGAAGEWDVVALTASPLEGRPLVNLTMSDRRNLSNVLQVRIREIANGETFDVRDGAEVSASFSRGQ